MSLSTGISIVIPNYNGATLLRENLPSIITAAQHWGGAYEIIVVDDCSPDSSCAVLGELFPQVTVIKNRANAGFSKTANAGMATAKYSIALCINNDVKVEQDFIAPLLEHFKDRDMFAVTPNILAERDGKNQGIVVGGFGKGFIRGGFAALNVRSAVRENLYAVGACVAYDLAKFRALGGYAEIYSPYLFEDVDISYRAWKRGWKSIYEPSATVYHYSSATIGKTKKRNKRIIYFRNRFLFHWINLTDPDFLSRNIFHTIVRLCFSFLWFDFSYYASFFGALKRLKEASAMRKEVIKTLVLGDQEIISRTSDRGHEKTMSCCEAVKEKPTIP